MRERGGRCAMIYTMQDGRCDVERKAAGRDNWIGYQDLSQRWAGCQ